MVKNDRERGIGNFLLSSKQFIEDSVEHIENNPTDYEYADFIPQHQKEFMRKMDMTIEDWVWREEDMPQNIHQKTKSPFLYQNNIGKIICYDCECWGSFAGQLGNCPCNCHIHRKIYAHR